MTTEQHYKVYDYINNVITLFDSPEDFVKCNFSVLCDKYPIQINKSNYIAKVLYISLKTDKLVKRLYPDKIKEYEIEYIILNSNTRRKLNYKMNEFFVNGNNETQTYKENDFYNYSIELVSNKTKELINQLREKYNLTVPSLFIGEHQELVLE